MQRSSIIATVIAAGGVLIAGSVASVAVINAASSSEVKASSLDLVSDDGSAPSSPAAVAPAATEATVAPVELPSLEASALPELPEVADASQAAAPAAPAQQTTQTTKTAKTQKAAKPASEPTQSTDPGVSSDQARSIVMKQGDGVKTLAVSKDTRSGYKTWAVRIERSNGEVITGYVDRESGVVVDWVVNAQPAATTTTTSGSSNGDDDSAEAESEDHSGSGSDDSDEHESEDHSGSDHDSDDD